MYPRKTELWLIYAGMVFMFARIDRTLVELCGYCRQIELL